MKTKQKAMASMLLIWTAPAMGQRIQVSYEHKPIDLHTGVHQGGPDLQEAYHDFVIISGAPWMRLHIADYHLGKASFIILRSALDGGEQRLDAYYLPLWQNATAIFNGDAVEIELHVAPGDEGVFVHFDQALAGTPDSAPHPRDNPDRSLCGADNRVASTDNRVGRLYFGGCTAWYITNGAFLTAGHCVDTDRDASGNPAPDGVVDLTGVVEFNVPASTSNGATVAANPNDQYPIVVASVNFFFDGVNSIGEDWAVFRVNPNANTGLMPWQAYSSVGFRPSRENPAANDTMRVTGFGLDNTPAGTGGGGAPCCTVVAGSCTRDCNAQNFTNQTNSGPFIAEDNDGANDISVEYQVDTTGGNSGSPVIWSAVSSGLTIGIHTNAGCGASTGNHGTAFEVNNLETAMRNVTSSLARFADVGHSFAATLGDGTILRPFDTVTEAVAAVPTGGVVSIVAGNYTAASGNTFIAGEDGKAMLFEAPVGTVVIGN